jgi:hypothetical protein
MPSTASKTASAQRGARQSCFASGFMGEESFLSLQAVLSQDKAGRGHVALIQ